MNRKKNFFYSSCSSIIKQIVSLICGMILPRLILTHYGSDVNGLISSIGQFLSLIGIFDAGMGVVVEASLYEHLAKNDHDAISAVMTSGKRFYNKIVQSLLVYVVILSLVYPSFVSKNFSFFYVFGLVWAISISSFGQYYFGVLNSVVITADQRGYVYYNIYSFATILNTLVCAIMIGLDAPIHIVKFGSSLVYFLRPIMLALYVKRHYKINWKQKYETEPIKQKWNGFAQHMATLVTGNTDIIVLTMFSSLENVSVYSVYYLVVNGLKEMINAGTAGVKSLFGDLYARNELGKLKSGFSTVEAFIHFGSVYIFAVAAVLIVPFISVYTRGVDDANYNAPVFGALLCLAYCIYCLRIPYNALIMSVGHFKETQTSSIIEAIVNISVSIFSVFRFGLLGVAIGTIVAMLYRSIYLANYANKVILKRSNFYSIKLFITDICLSAAITFILNNILILKECTYVAWAIMGLKACCITLPVLGVVFLLGAPKSIFLAFSTFRGNHK